MGGAREETIQTEKVKNETTIQLGKKQKKLLKKKKKQKSTKQALRIHESGGEVHFHNDDAGLKAAVPIAAWWAAWDKLKNFQICDWSYLDKTRGIMVEVVVYNDKDGKLEASVSLDLVSTDVGDTFAALDRFSTKQMESGK